MSEFTLIPTPSPSSRARRLVGTDVERCPYCEGTAIRREGKREKKYETVQLWYCRSCDRVFTPQRAKGKTYPLKIILESIMHYYQGYTRAQTSQRITERFGIVVPPRTLSNWIAEYRPLTTYARLRGEGAKLFRPNRIVRATRLQHQQVYEFRIHQAKLSSILASPEHRKFDPVKSYLYDVVTACPHQFFQGEARASQLRADFDLNAVEIKSKRNHACRLADRLLQTVTHAKRRHDELQRFMLTTDSVTVAVEVPVYLTVEDLAVFKATAGFEVPIEAPTTLTGHIDVLQIRHGAVYILDYKPNAKWKKPIGQLMVYALALSRRTGLRLFDFVCGWFDVNWTMTFRPHTLVSRSPQEGPGAA
jgi:hypothetical protein